MKNRRFSLFLALLFSLTTTNFIQPMKRQTTQEPSSEYSKPIKRLCFSDGGQYSPDKITTNVKNYCRTILSALNDDDLNLMHEEFHHFYNKVSYEMHIKEAKFYRALSCCLCNALSNGKSTVFTEDDIVFMKLESKTCIYVLQFRTIKDAKEQPEPIYRYRLSRKEKHVTKPIRVIAITFLISDTRAELKINEIDNNGDCSVKIHRQAHEYISPNSYTNMIEMLFNSSGLASVDRGRMIAEIYNQIPNSWRIYNEKFFQSMLFCIITFFRSCFAEAEMTTANGRVDIVMKGIACNSILEFKFKRSARDALDQITDRNYSGYFNDSGKPVIEIGIDVDVANDKVIVNTLDNIYKSIWHGGMQKVTSQKNS